MIAARETAELAKQLIADTVEKQNIDPGTLTFACRSRYQHALPAGGPSARRSRRRQNSQPSANLDNPFSEAQFKTLKYGPDFPPRFGSIEDARAHCREFFDWYNTIHGHCGIGYMTPRTVHYGNAIALTPQRAETLNTAFVAHPQRVKGIAPKPPALPTAA
jgi:putative transposase